MSALSLILAMVLTTTMLGALLLSHLEGFLKLDLFMDVLVVMVGSFKGLHELLVSLNRLLLGCFSLNVLNLFQ